MNEIDADEDVETINTGDNTGFGQSNWFAKNTKTEFLKRPLKRPRMKHFRAKNSVS
jgi:hypothetical protein